MNKTNEMKNDEYHATRDLLLQAGRMVDLLDLNGFRDRIRYADSVGSMIDPTLHREAHKNLQEMDELAAAAIRLKAAFQSVKRQVALELQKVGDDE